MKLQVQVASVVSLPYIEGRNNTNSTQLKRIEEKIKEEKTLSNSFNKVLTDEEKRNNSQGKNTHARTHTQTTIRQIHLINVCKSSVHILANHTPKYIIKLGLSQVQQLNIDQCSLLYDLIIIISVHADKLFDKI